MTLAPTKPPNDLTVIISRLNRYEIENRALLAGPPGLLLKDTLNDYGYDWESTLFTTDTTRYPSTSKVLLLGASAAQSYNFAGDLSVNRGYVRGVNQQFCCTFLPVDCEDIVDLESAMFGGDEEGDDDGSSTHKDTAPTRRGNYRFWFRADIEKLLLGVRRAIPITNTTTLNENQLIQELAGHSGRTLYIDIETFPRDDCVQCFAFAFDAGAIISVPIYDHRGASRYALAPVICALARAARRNTVVAHNIMFDLPFLFHFHGVPFGAAMADTMLQQHRCFPEAEKSLAHAMSYWLNVESHKGDGIFHCHTWAQYAQLLAYNAKDVAVTRAIYLAQREHAARTPGLQDSFDQVNDSIYDYMMESVTGYQVDVTRQKMSKDNVRARVAQLIRAFRILVGSAEFNPASNKQVSEWLYTGLSYTPPTKTDSGAASVDAKSLLLLTAKYPENVALRLLLMIRDLEKTLSMLEFTPYYQPESRAP